MCTRVLQGFQQFRCDRNISLGISLASMAKVLKCAGNEDVITLKAEDSGDAVTFMFESPSALSALFFFDCSLSLSRFTEQTRISHFSLKLMDIDSEHLGIPETDYKCVVKMPSSEFQRICKEMR